MVTSSEARSYPREVAVTKVSAMMRDCNASLAEEKVVEIVDRVGGAAKHLDAALYRSIVEEAVRSWVEGDVMKVCGMMASILLNQQQVLERIQAQQTLGDTPKAPGDQKAALERLASTRDGELGSSEKVGKPAPHEVLLEKKKKPTTYAEALEQVGGVEKLEKFRALGTSLMEKYGVSPEMAKVVPPGRQFHSLKLNYQKYVNHLDELLDRCAEQQEAFFQTVREIASKTKGMNYQPPMKSKDRCIAKAHEKYRDASGGVAWYRLSDVLRDTIVYETLDDMYEGLRFMDEDLKLDIVEFNDRFLFPLAGGCRDLQFCVRIGGVICELQLNVADMLYVKESSGNRYFQVARELAAAVADTGEEAVKRAQRTLSWAQDHLGRDSGNQLKEILSSRKKPYLLKAAQAGNARLVSIFLEYGADANVQDEISGQTALHKVMEGGFEQAMWALLEHGAQVDLEDKDGIAPLMEGLLRLRGEPDNEFLSRTVCVLAQVAGIDHLRDSRNKLDKVVQKKLKQSTELPAHCLDGDVRKVRELLNSYADANSLSADKERPLHKALTPIGGFKNFTEGHLQICRLLVQFNADCNARNSSGSAPLALAARLGSTEVMDMLWQHGASTESVKAEDLSSLLQSEVDEKVQIAALSWLHTAGCDFTTTTEEGELPTFVAARCGNTAVLQVLMDARCDLGWRNRSGDAAIVAAARKGQVGAVKWLLHPAVDAVDFQRAWNAASKLSKPDDEHDNPDQPSHQDLVRLFEEAWSQQEEALRQRGKGVASLRNLCTLDQSGPPKETDFERVVLTAAKQTSQSSGAYYFEVQLLSRFARINAGWATTGYQRSRDLGFDTESWCWQSQDGGGMFQVHAAKGPEVPLQPWEPGDVLGLALDFSSGKMQLSHQGTWHTEAGYSMDFQSNGRDLYPAVTMKWGMFRLRLGREAWIYQPPSAKYRPWAAGVGEWASEALLGDRSWGFDAQLLARKPRMIGLGALGDCEAPRSASSWFAAGLPELSRSSGKFYYELRLLSRPESPRVGWATADFSGGAIGGDPESFAFEGWRMMKWNAGLSSQAALKPWRPGDVLGLAVDLDAGKMSLRCHRDDGWLRIKSVSLEEARRMLQASIDDGDISDSELSEVVTFLGQEGRILEEDRSDDTVYIEMSDGNTTWVPATMLKALLEDEEPEDVREMHFDPKGRKLHPAASMLGGFRCYLGRDAWLYEPPGAEYEAWGSGVFEWAPEDWRAGSTCAGKPCLVGLRCLRPTELPMEEGWRDGFQELRSLWLTAGAKEAARGSGKLYHEIQLISDLSNPQVGWMSTKFKEGEQDGNGLGDDEEGYGFDGDRHLQWKAGKSMKVKIQPWKQGTVLGLAIDLDAGVMRLSHQGKWHNENEEGYIIKAELTGRDWYPAISMRGFYQMHLDRRTWRFTPPSPDYEAWASGIFEWAPQHF